DKGLALYLMAVIKYQLIFHGAPLIPHETDLSAPLFSSSFSSSSSLSLPPLPPSLSFPFFLSFPSFLPPFSSPLSFPPSSSPPLFFALFFPPLSS
ncbi:hypothetical protein ACXWR7_10295, partial [Streptococcus pyogenes]